MLTDLHGLVHVASRKLSGSVHELSYQFTTDANQDTVGALLACVSDERELTFFDGKHPQLSDPGAYISVVRSPEGLLAQRANHGWSSDWTRITEQEATRYLLLCASFHTPPSLEYLTVTEPSNWKKRRPVDTSPSSSFRRYLDERLA